MKPYLAEFLLLLWSHYGYGQLEFTKQKRFFFVGSENVQGRKIVSGAEIFPVDSNNLKIKIDILDNWIRMDSLNVLVKIDTSSIKRDVYFITQNNRNTPSYRFFNDEDGLEILIAKERWHEGFNNSNRIKSEKNFSMSVIKIFLTKKRRLHIQTFPLMFEK